LNQGNDLAGMHTAYLVITLITVSITAGIAAAAAGLVLFFVGAVLTHLRAGVLYNIAFPGASLCLSAASLALLVAQGY
jgi:uncharacterized membrane protein YdbT with pleckstrin-like domain